MNSTIMSTSSNNNNNNNSNNQTPTQEEDDTGCYVLQRAKAIPTSSRRGRRRHELQRQGSWSKISKHSSSSSSQLSFSNPPHQQKQQQKQQKQHAGVMICSSFSSRVLIRSVSGLGMEDPVFTNPKKQDDVVKQDAPDVLNVTDSPDDEEDDTQDWGTVASDPTADLHTGMGFQMACLESLSRMDLPLSFHDVDAANQHLPCHKQQQQQQHDTDEEEEQDSKPNCPKFTLDDALKSGTGRSIEPPKRVVRKQSCQGEEVVYSPFTFYNSSYHAAQPEVPSSSSSSSAPRYHDPLSCKDPVPSTTPMTPGGADQPPKMIQRVDSQNCLDSPSCSSHSRDSPQELLPKYQHHSITPDKPDNHLLFWKIPLILKEFQESQAMEAFTQSLPEFPMDNLPQKNSSTRPIPEQEDATRKLSLAMNLSRTKQDLSSLRKNNPRRAPALHTMVSVGKTTAEPTQYPLPSDVLVFLAGQEKQSSFCGQQRDVTLARLSRGKIISSRRSRSKNGLTSSLNESALVHAQNPDNSLGVPVPDPSLKSGQDTTLSPKDNEIATLLLPTDLVSDSTPPRSMYTSHTSSELAVIGGDEAESTVVDTIISEEASYPTYATPGSFSERVEDTLPCPVPTSIHGKSSSSESILTNHNSSFHRRIHNSPAHVRHRKKLLLPAAHLSNHTNKSNDSTVSWPKKGWDASNLMIGPSNHCRELWRNDDNNNNNNCLAAFTSLHQTTTNHTSDNNSWPSWVSDGEFAD